MQSIIFTLKKMNNKYSDSFVNIICKIINRISYNIVLFVIFIKR